MPGNNHKVVLRLLKLLFTTNHYTKHRIMQKPHIYIISLALIATSCSSDSDSSTPTPSIQTPDGYTLVWSDEFDGNELNASNWKSEIGGGGWGNQEKQYYTDGKNIGFEDGCLIIEARKESVGSNNYTSGRIISKGLREFTYGYLEARISLPSGAGTWPAFWMLGANNKSWPLCGELDIMEHVGKDPTMISHAIHTQEKNGSRGNQWSNKQTRANVENEFHTYAIEWIQDADQGCDCIKFLIDGEVSTTVWEKGGTASAESNWPFNHSFFIILNVAMGGTWGSTINDSALPTQMKVDYVRLFKKL